MTDRTLSPRKLAQQLRRHEATCRDVRVVLMHRQLRGEADLADNHLAANLVRAMPHLYAAIQELPGRQRRGSRNMPTVVSPMVAESLTMVAAWLPMVLAAGLVLALAPVSPGPLAVALAMTPAAVASRYTGLLMVKHLHRPPTADTPLLPAATGATDPVVATLQDVVTELEELLSEEDPPERLQKALSHVWEAITLLTS